MNLKSVEIFDKEFYKLNTPSEYLLNQIKEDITNDNSYSSNKNAIVSFLNVKLDRDFSSPNIYLLTLYDYLLNIKKIKYDILWKNETLYLIDKMPGGRELLIKYKVNLDNTKYSSYNIYSLEKVAGEIDMFFKNYSYTSGLFLEDTRYKKLENRFMSYYNPKYVKWNEILDKNPNIILANIAHNSGYELKPHEIKKICNNFLFFISTPRYTNILSLNIIENLKNFSLLFAKIINESPCFEHTLINSKNIHLSVAKFLNLPKDRYDEKIKVFCENLTNYPGFLKDNLDRKLLRKESLILFNTLYPNSEQIEIIKNQKEKPKKKMKI